MKMQKFPIFEKINMLRINNVAKLGTTVIIQVNAETLDIAYVI